MGLRYYLPETRVVLSGVIEHTTTKFRDDQEPTTSSDVLSTGVEWTTAADEQWSGELSLDPGWMKEQLTKLSFTPDRRLAGVTRNTTSRATKIVKAAATLAGGAVAGGLLFDRRVKEEIDASRLAYDRARKTESKELGELRDQLAAARTALRTARGELLSAEPGPASDAANRRVRQLDHLVDSLELDVDAASARFRAWKASRTTTRTETLETVLEMRQLPRWDGQALDWESAAPPAAGHLGARAVWDRLGFTLARVTPPRTPTEPEGDEPGVLVRVPRTEVFVLLRRRGDGDAAPIEVESLVERSVLDDRCDVELVPLKDKPFGDRNITIEFDADGVMVSLSREDKGGAEDAVGAIKEGFTDGLTSAKTALEAVDSFANHAEAVRQAKLTRDLDIAKSEIELAGLGATRREAAELARLKQLAELGAQYESIAGTGASSVAELLARDPAAMSWYRAPTPAPPPPPPEPQVIRVEIVGPREQ